MQEMTMEGFMRLFQSQWGQEANFMGIAVELPDTPEHEIIINPKANFEKKMTYYAKTYDNDLVMKVNPNIKIVNFAFGRTFAEVQAELGIE